MVLLYNHGFFIYNKTMLKIKSVESGSIAEELGLCKKDEIIKINRKEICDVLEFLEQESKKKLNILVKKQNGSQELLCVKKDAMEGLGVELEENFEIKEWANNCVFCFINQLPKGLRKTLYIKDDDFRMSFSNGNFVTLTNATKADIKRIERLRLSPLYVSVHAVTPRIRNSLLCNHSGGNIVKIIKRLSKKIEIHAQIVLVPGFNDGKELEKTLIAVVPYVKTIAVVPVGLTKFRKGLPKLNEVNKAVAQSTINTIEKMQNLCQKWFGRTTCYAADEFYILAKRPTPNYASYGNFDQIENGVGMVSKFKQEFLDALNELKPTNKKRCVSIATGTSFYPIFKNLTDLLQQKCKNVKVNMYPITNDFFGKSVTTTGLIVGKDLIAQLKDKDLGENLLLSNCMLRDGTKTFLDNTTVQQLEQQLNTKVIITENSGENVLKQIVGEK